MKKLMYIFMLCLLSAAVVAAEEAPAAKQAPAADTGNKPGTSSGLLKTGTKNVITREVTGQGRNRDEAIKNALYRAVEQTRGVKVDSGRYEFGYRGAGAGISSEQPGQRRIDFDSIDVATEGTVYTTEIGGLVKSYDVLEEKQIDPDTYQVKLRVSVYDYASRGQTQRVKIALMPVKTMQNSYSFLNLTIPGDMLSSLFSQRLAMGLTQTNKFAVLDRESISDFVGEKRMLLSFDAPLAEQAKLAETLGADYLLVGTITQAVIEKIDKELKAANYTVTEFKARFNFNYRLVDSATKQIVVASNVQKYLENEEVRKLADEQDPAEWNSSQVRDAFISLIANDVIEAIIDRVYPIKIAAIQQGDEQMIILNQGGERMAEGMLLDVFKQGKEVFDTDTNESLGTIENRIATIEVQKVAQTMSYAKVVSGEASQISKGLVCRVKKPVKTEEVGAKPDIIRTEKGGVKLPFDN
jgi:curli biogenesis system outer membrane secretion channel CsgG